MPAPENLASLFSFISFNFTTTYIHQDSGEAHQESPVHSVFPANRLITLQSDRLILQRLHRFATGQNATSGVSPDHTARGPPPPPGHPCAGWRAFRPRLHSQ